jgi:hypothetical protein
MSKGLTKAQVSALKECEYCMACGVLYWWRRATMVQLAGLGLAETWISPSLAHRPNRKVKPYRLTPAGRALLQSESKP